MGPCLICPRTRDPIQGDGPLPCRVACVGESPGKVENATGYVFSGPTGEEYTYIYLPLAGLERGIDVRTTNAVSCMLARGRTPKPYEVLACAEHNLREELDAVEPQVVVLMGESALTLVPDLKPLEVHHGFPYRRELFGRQVTVFPTYHPAAGLHDGARVGDLRDDFKALGHYLRTGLSLRPQDSLGAPFYKELDRVEEVREYFGDPVSLDTETHHGKFWCLTFSSSPGCGFMIDAKRLDLLAEFQRLVEKYLPRVLIQNLMFDVPVLEQSIVSIPEKCWFDTMIRAYHLGLPQSLKVLSYRLLGMEMQEYKDVLEPYQTAVGEAYLRRVAEFMQYPKQGRRPTLNSKIKRIFSDRERLGKDSVDIRDRWENILESDETAQGVEEIPELGRFPVIGIGDIPRGVATKYSCKDADGTLRLYPELQRRAVALRRSVGRVDRLK